MKYLLILAVVLVGIWLWRSSRPSDQKRTQRETKAAPEPLDMVSCVVCSVHVPSVDAIRGKNGWYCSVDHLHRAER